MFLATVGVVDENSFSKNSFSTKNSFSNLQREFIFKENLFSKNSVTGDKISIFNENSFSKKKTSENT